MDSASVTSTSATTGRPARTWTLWVSAAILALTAVVHVVLGTPEQLAALSGVAPQEAGTFLVVWHLCSVLLVTFPVVLVWAVRADPVAARPTVAYVWGLCLVLLVLFVLVDVVRLGSLLALPQWTLFVAPVVLLPLGRPVR